MRIIRKALFTLVEKMIERLVRVSLSLLNSKIMPRKQKKTHQSRKPPKLKKTVARDESSEDIDYCHAE